MTTEGSRRSSSAAAKPVCRLGYHLNKQHGPFVILDANERCRRRVAFPVGFASPLHAETVLLPEWDALHRRSQSRADEGVMADYLEAHAAVSSNPIAGMLVADLSESQRATVVQVLDGMVRERSGGNGPAVLTAPLNIGIGTK